MMVMRTECGDNKFTGVIMGLNLNGPMANDERYTQRERKVRARILPMRPSRRCGDTLMRWARNSRRTFWRSTNSASVR